MIKGRAVGWGKGLVYVADRGINCFNGFGK